VDYIMGLSARIIVLATVLIGSGEGVEARGALVVGACGAWGAGWNFDTESKANDRAMSECKGRDCKVVATFNRLCAAFSTDSSRECGAWGWATRETRRMAEAAALRECQNSGGKECRILGQFCDGQ
jgi:Domain of unknown function (DUF4189)